MAEKLIITAAVTGSRPTKEMNPAVPYTPEEIIQAAVECRRAGAAIVHVHVRDPQTGRPDFRIDLFKRVLEGIRERCDILVNLTTSGLHLEGPDAIRRRLQPISLKPDICSLDIGSINFVDRAFINPPEWGELASRAMLASGVKPEIEVFDTGHIAQAVDLIKRGLIAAPPYFQLCMGVKWGIGASEENLIFMKNKLPANAIWGVLGTGWNQMPMIASSARLGGHIRVGFEDNIYLKSNQLAKSNAELVEMAAALALRFGREIASPEEAHSLLHINTTK